MDRPPPDTGPAPPPGEPHGALPLAPPESVWRRVRAWLARHEGWISAVVLVALLTWRWPVVKGYYYKLAAVPAPAAAIAWRTDVDEALADAGRDGKHVVVDFTADWCPPCLAMKHDVWPDPRVAGAIARGYVPVLIDVDHDPATTARYGVGGIPTVLILDAGGAVLASGAPLTASGMVGFLEAPR